MKKIKNFLGLVGNIILTLWGLSLVISLIFGIFTQYSMIHFFGLLVGGFVCFGIPLAIIDFFSSFGKQTNGGSGYSGRNGGNSYSGRNGGGRSENAPYQGDRSMVGGVVGGSITNPVGGRAGQ